MLHQIGPIYNYLYDNYLTYRLQESRHNDDSYVSSANLNRHNAKLMAAGGENPRVLKMLITQMKFPVNVDVLTKV